MHHAAHNVPFENHPVHGVCGKPEHLLALRELEFRQLALGDVARIDDHTADQRILESGYVARLQPTVRAVLVANAEFPRKTRYLTCDQRLKLSAKRSNIIRVDMVEDMVRLAFFGGVAE